MMRIAIDLLCALVLVGLAPMLERLGAMVRAAISGQSVPRLQAGWPPLPVLRADQALGAMLPALIACISGIAVMTWPGGSDAFLAAMLLLVARVVLWEAAAQASALSPVLMFARAAEWRAALIALGLVAVREGLGAAAGSGGGSFLALAVVVAQAQGALRPVDPLGAMATRPGWGGLCLALVRGAWAIWLAVAIWPVGMGWGAVLALGVHVLLAIATISVAQGLWFAALGGRALSRALLLGGVGIVLSTLSGGAG